MTFRADLKLLRSAIRKDGAVPTDPLLSELVIALEDKRFVRHFGVDLLALARSIVNYLSGTPRGGASTIDMQLVRTLTGRFERTLLRKLREMILAVVIRRDHTPMAILATYLKCAYTGTGLRGMEHAALSLFDSEVQACTARQKAILSALLLVPAPAPNARTCEWRRKLAHRADRAEARRDRLFGCSERFISETVL